MPSTPDPSASSAPADDGERSLPAGGGEGDGAPAWAPDLDLDTPPRPGAGRILATLLSLALAGALLGWGLPRVTGTGWEQILVSLGSLPVWAPPAMIVLGAAAVALEALTVRTAVPGARYPDALRAHAAGTALGTAVPGGGLLGPLLLGSILRRAGLGVRVILTGVVAASLVDLAVSSVAVPLAGLGAYALAALAALGGGAALDLPGGIWAAVLGLAGGLVALLLMLVLLRRDVLAGLLAQAREVLPLPAAAPGGAEPTAVVLAERDRLVRLLRARPLALLAPTLLARLAQGVAFLLALQAVDAAVPLLPAVAIFALGRVLALVPITPGGAGITETVAALALVALGVAAADAAAAVLLLTVATWVVPLLAGVLAVLVPGGRRRG